MPEGLSAYLGVAVIALVTFGTRVGGAFAMERVALSPRIERFLESLSVSVLAALVVNAVASGGLREVVALVVSVAVMVLSRRPVAAMAAGAATGALWTGLAA